MARSYRRVSFETKLRRTLKRRLIGPALARRPLSQSESSWAPREAVYITFYLLRSVASIYWLTWSWLNEISRTALLTG